jgi:hypothetical protein
MRADAATKDHFQVILMARRIQLEVISLIANSKAGSIPLCSGWRATNSTGLSLAPLLIHAKLSDILFTYPL